MWARGGHLSLKIELSDARHYVKTNKQKSYRKICELWLQIRRHLWSTQVSSWRIYWRGQKRKTKADSCIQGIWNTKMLDSEDRLDYHCYNSCSGPGRDQPYCQRRFIPRHKFALGGRGSWKPSKGISVNSCLLHHRPPSPPLPSTSSTLLFLFTRKHSTWWPYHL